MCKSDIATGRILGLLGPANGTAAHTGPLVAKSCVVGGSGGKDANIFHGCDTGQMSGAVVDVHGSRQFRATDENHTIPCRRRTCRTHSVCPLVYTPQNGKIAISLTRIRWSYR